MGNKIVCLAVAAASLTACFSVLANGPFVEVTDQVGFIKELKKSKDAPIWGDFNNDGILDLIVSCHGLSVSHGPFVYLGSASGRFTDIRSTCGFSNLSQFNSLDSTDWHGMSLGDYDNDGNLDLYIAEGGLGQRGGTLKRDLLFKGHGNGTFTYVSDIAGIVTSGDRGREGFWVDYDNDGKLDLFVKNYITTNGFVNNNHLYHNNGNGTFAQAQNAGGLAAATFGMHTGSITSFADYDNDGYMDVAFAGEASSAALYHNQRNGTFVDVTKAAGLSARVPTQGVAWGDYNNDGLLDLYVASGNEGSGPFKATLYRNNGNGTFTDVTDKAGVGTTGNTWSPIWGDYDNDGFLDLFVTCAGSGALGASAGNANLLYHNNGNGTFTNVAAAEGVQLDDGGKTLHRAGAWGDYNNDGYLDLVLKEGSGPEGADTGPAVGLHRLFQNRHTDNGNHFIKVNLVGVRSNRNGIGARVTATYNGGTAFRENNGGGGGEFWSQGSEPLHFGIGRATQATLRVVWPSGIVTSLTVAANSTLTILERAPNSAAVRADFNNDGQSDILWQNTSGARAIWLMNGTGRTSSVSLGTITPSWNIVGSGDFNGDGKADILWQNTSGERFIWLMNGTVRSGIVNFGTIDPSWNIAGSGDFNGDGKADILWQNTSGARAIWLMNGTVRSSVVSLGAVDPAWKIAGSGDFNGDGKTDILWQNTSGARAIWLMNGTVRSSIVSLGIVDPSWLIAGTGDFNADGKTDILWQQNSGDRVVWFMNGTVRSSASDLGAVDPSWSIRNY